MDKRSVLPGIATVAALAVGLALTFARTQEHPVSADGLSSGAQLADSRATAPMSISPSPSLSSARPSPVQSSARPSPMRSTWPSLSQSSATPSSRQLRSVTSTNVFVGVAVKGGIISGVRSFSSATGAHIAMVEIYTLFDSRFPWGPLHRVTSTGARPLIQWNPRGTSLARIAAGGYDTYLRHYAASFKRFRRPVVLSFGHEMNGSWYSWGAAHVRPSTFVAAWRHIHHVFSLAGVHNVTWSWDPSHVGELPRPWWPGRHYVGKIGIDGYQRPGDTFTKIFAHRLAYIRTFTSKPIYIAETSVAPSSGQARQIWGLFNGVRQHHLSGFVWFDINALETWRLEGRRSAVRAFRRALAQ
jgi:glycosyl hydrolase family 26